MKRQPLHVRLHGCGWDCQLGLPVASVAGEELDPGAALAYKSIVEEEDSLLGFCSLLP